MMFGLSVGVNRWKRVSSMVCECYYVSVSVSVQLDCPSVVVTI